jgi:hypothetical protein
MQIGEWNIESLAPGQNKQLEIHLPSSNTPSKKTFKRPSKTKSHLNKTKA